MSSIDFNETAKIRKFIFQDMKRSDLMDVYYSYWLELENNLLGNSGENLLEKFFVDYLTIQNSGRITKPENLMKDFLDFYQKVTKFQEKENVLKNIYRYSVYYIQICNGRISDEKIKEKIDIINSHNAKDAYPFLMEVFEDYDFAHINKNMLLDILNTVIGFIEERNSKNPSQMAVSFAGLSDEINKMMILKDYMPRFIAEPDEDSKAVTINQLS